MTQHAGRLIHSRSQIAFKFHNGFRYIDFVGRLLAQLQPAFEEVSYDDGTVNARSRGRGLSDVAVNGAGLVIGVTLPDTHQQFVDQAARYAGAIISQVEPDGVSRVDVRAHYILPVADWKKASVEFAAALQQSWKAIWPPLRGLQTTFEWSEGAMMGQGVLASAIRESELSELPPEVMLVDLGIADESEDVYKRWKNLALDASKRLEEIALAIDNTMLEGVKSHDVE